MQSDIAIVGSMADAKKIYNESSKEEGGVVLLSICDKGYYYIMIGGKRHYISTGDILICPPGFVIGDSNADRDDAIVKFLCVKYSTFLRLIRTGRNVWSILMYARLNPVFHLDENDRELTSSYYKVIEGKMKTRRSYYYDEIMLSIIQCVIYELCVILNREMGQEENTDGKIKQRDVIFKKFMEQLSQNEGRQRSVKYYADLLCVSPKYLSSISMDICGISAHELILSNVATMIQQDLEFSSISISELAQKYGFPNLSVFGKFVKKRLGASPRDYRNKTN